jgi:uncharacterized membrane protein
MAALALCSAQVLAKPPSPPPKNAMTALLPLDGHNYSDPFGGLNESNIIVGYSAIFSPDGFFGETKAVYWDRSGAVHWIGIYGDCRSVNESGQMTGLDYDTSLGYVYDLGTGKVTYLTPFDPPGPDTYSWGRSINDFGDVAGLGSVGGVTHALLWTHNQVASGAPPIDLGTLHGGGSSVFAMNNNGQITGLSEGLPVAWLPTAGGYQIVELPNLGGDFDYGRGINDLGEVVGQSQRVPFVWELPSLDRTQLRAPAGIGPNGVANGINNRSEIVGYIDGDPQGGMYWRNGGSAPVQLGTLAGGTFSFPRAINDAGVIVGFGDNATLGGVAWVIWRN